MAKNTYKPLPYVCPVCKTEMAAAVFNSDLKEFGKVVCPVCKRAEMKKRRTPRDNRKDKNR